MAKNNYEATLLLASTTTDSQGRITTGIEHAAADGATNPFITRYSEKFLNYTMNLNLGYTFRVPCEEVNFSLLTTGDTLNCSGKRISIEDLKSFLDGRPDITKLNLSNCGLEVNKIICFFHNNPSSLSNITQIDFSSNYINDYAFMRLIRECNANRDELTNLKELTFHNCNLTSTSINYAASKFTQYISTFDNIDCSNNDISDESVLAKLPHKTLLPTAINTQQEAAATSIAAKDANITKKLAPDPRPIDQTVSEVQAQIKKAEVIETVETIKALASTINLDNFEQIQLILSNNDIQGGTHELVTSLNYMIHFSSPAQQDYLNQIIGIITEHTD